MTVARFRCAVPKFPRDILFESSPIQKKKKIFWTILIILLVRSFWEIYLVKRNKPGRFSSPSKKSEKVDLDNGSGHGTGSASFLSNGVSPPSHFSTASFLPPPLFTGLPVSQMGTQSTEKKVNPCKQLEGKQYLLSAAPYGPNNQLIGIKEAAVLAKATNRTFILPYLRLHYSQRRNDISQELNFEDIFDIKSLQSFVPVVHAKDILKCGWHNIDQVVAFGGFPERYIKWHAETAGFSLPEETKWKGINGSKENCSSLIGWAKKEFSTDSIVMVASYKSLTDDMKSIKRSNGELSIDAYLQFASDPENHECAAEMIEVSRAIHLNSILQLMADGWIQDNFDGTPNYLAIHVRPYADGCVGAWHNANENGLLNETLADSVCSASLGTPMFNNLGHAVLSIMVQRKLDKIFLMSHPKIIDVVKDRLLSANISETSIFTLSLEDMTVLFGSPCSLRHLFVEQYIATKSLVFVHTLPSSIGLNIVMGRNQRESNTIILQDFIDENFRALD